MTTVIRFIGAGDEGGPMSTYVTDGPDQVLESWTASRGMPFGVTHEESGQTIYVNPQNIACWFEQGPQVGG